jgi:hypothetical protein
MEFRVLTPDEIEALPDEFYRDVDKLGLNEKYPGDTAGRFVGAFDEDRLVGVWAVLLQVHCGPLWVAEDRRKPSTAIRDGMWQKVKEVLNGFGAKRVYMFAMDDVPQVRRIIERLPHRKIDGQPYLIGD